MGTANMIAEVLLRHDPVNIHFPEYGNTDEYVPEANDIAEGLISCTSEAECLELVYSSFVRNFGQAIAGDRDRYGQIAAEIWALRDSQEKR
jgi:hypothetical protein